MDELRVNNEVKTEGDSIQYIVIKLGAEQYGIDIKYVDNIVRMQHITRVPKVAGYLKGVINLRGEVIPVMNLRLKMGLPEQEAITEPEPSAESRKNIKKGKKLNVVTEE